MAHEGEQYQDPRIVIGAMTDMVDAHDACMVCGYQFGYIHEGCDDCLPITELLAKADQGFEEET